MSSQSNPWQIPVSRLRGVGSSRAAQLERLELKTLGDILLHRPRRYEDRRNFQRIADIKLDEPALVRGKITAAGIRGGRKKVFEFILDDGSGRLHCRWWNLPFMAQYFAMGDEVLVYGNVLSLRPRTMDHPETEVVQDVENSIHLNRLAPVYPLTEGLPQRWLRSLIWRLLEEFASAAPELHPEIQTPEEFPSRARALWMLHFPETMEETETARQRLALDEFIELQVAIQTRRKNLETNVRAQPCAGDNHLIKPLLASLGFKLTAAQTKVLKEIRQDMAGPHPMRRLLQGDVGSGKTVVAACTALMALESKKDVALMAPTEILAAQHLQNFRRWFEPLGISVEFQGRGVSPTPALYIGTHALLEKTFAPRHLGLVIIDEQHKFGVAQRETLLRKGSHPHLLVMTATPIPRTLGLTLYGDLDISIIDEAPAGRGKVKTFVRDAASLPKVWEFMRGKLAHGGQGYIVYARLEEGNAALKAVTQEFHSLEKIFAGYRIALAHGRLKPEERERVMKDFRANKIQLLLATSVIEVGVDVANANVMVIENAEQFGLAQLHQLRGRIGRGAGDSYCILIAAGKTPEARQRLKIMSETNDGFRLAEADLQWRGPGEFLGRRQSGAAPLRFGDLARDISLVELARRLVKETLKVK